MFQVSYMAPINLVKDTSYIIWFVKYWFCLIIQFGKSEGKWSTKAPTKRDQVGRVAGLLVYENTEYTQGSRKWDTWDPVSPDKS